MEMECPYIGTKGVCGASVTGMCPSSFELNIYCHTEDHYRCPILLARTLREGNRDAGRRAAFAI